jgi:thioredoxin 1
VKKLLKLLSLLFVGVIVASSGMLETKQHGGIEFKHVSLKEAQKEAKKSNKIIFIDAYTSWCGPCKKMAATSFKNEEVGEIYNKQFINLKIDCEKDADGPEISRRYKISSYPTLLFIDATGKLKKQVVGFQTPERLMFLANSFN